MTSASRRIFRTRWHVITSYSIHYTKLYDGPVVVKAQVPTGKRGKSGGVKLAATPEEAKACAAVIIGMEIGGHKVEKVLVEEQMPIERELYARITSYNVCYTKLLRP